ncbi:MAG TPA: RidA family protein [Chryseosolibacter sp.]
MKLQHCTFLIVGSLTLLFGCTSIKMRVIDPASTSYAQAVQISDFDRLVFVSGQIPTNNDREPSTDFKEQCRTVWRNIEKQLAACDMTLTDIVKVTTYLADRKYREPNYTIRDEVLGTHSPALTVIVADIYDEKWLLEIEVIAAR